MHLNKKELCQALNISYKRYYYLSKIGIIPRQKLYSESIVKQVKIKYNKHNQNISRATLAAEIGISVGKLDYAIVLGLIPKLKHYTKDHIKQFKTILSLRNTGKSLLDVATDTGISYFKLRTWRKAGLIPDKFHYTDKEIKSLVEFSKTHIQEYRGSISWMIRDVEFSSYTPYIWHVRQGNIPNPTGRFYSEKEIAFIRNFFAGWKKVKKERVLFTAGLKKAGATPTEISTIRNRQLFETIPYITYGKSCRNKWFLQADITALLKNFRKNK